MFIHVALLVIVSILGLAEAQRKTKNRNTEYLFLFISLFLVFLIQALRSTSVGIDTYRYYLVFRSIANSGTFASIKNWEILYIMLNRLVAAFSHNVQYLYALCSLIIDAGIFYFIWNNREESGSVFWPLFFWITFSTYLNSMNVVRQSIAIAFTINIYTVLKKEEDRYRFIKAFILLGIGYLFHTAAIVCVVFFVPFLIKRIDKKYITLFGIVGAFAIFFTDRIIELVLRIFPVYTKYLEAENFAGTEGIGGYYVILSLVKIALIILVFTLKPTKENKTLYILSSYMLVSILLYFMKTRVGLANRLAYYLDSYTLLFIPAVIERIKYHRKEIYVLAYLFGWVMYMYLLINPGGSRGCVPYTFFWQ